MSAQNNEFSHQDGVSLKQYVDTRFNATDQKINDLAQLLTVMVEQINENTTLARVGMERRLDGMNEFRDALKDAQARFVIVETCASRHHLIETDIRYLRESKATLDGKASKLQSKIAVGIALGGLLLAFTGIVLSIVLH